MHDQTRAAVLSIQEGSPIREAFCDAHLVGHITNVNAIKGRLGECRKDANGYAFGEKAGVILKEVDVDVVLLYPR